MKVILVNGSPHKNGCTFTALSEVGGALNKNGVDTEVFWLGSGPVSGCIACGKCFATGECFMDDCANEFRRKAVEADGFVFGTPVHFASSSGALTSFMDRAFYCGDGPFRGKPAATVTSCRRAGATATFDQINKYYTIRNMPVVSSQYWNMVHGNTPEEVAQDLEGLQVMRVLGNNMAWLLKCIEAGKKAGIDFPAGEQRVATNFIR